MAQWTTVERKGKGKGSLAAGLRDRGFASLAAVCKDRKLGPEAGAELSSLFKALEAGGFPGASGSGGGGAAWSRQPPWRQGGGSPKPRQRQAAPSEGKAARTCFHCGMQGHIAKDCRRRPAPTVFDWISADLDQVSSDKKAKPRSSAQAVAWACEKCGAKHANQDKENCRRCGARRCEGPVPAVIPPAGAGSSPSPAAAPGAGVGPSPSPGDGTIGDDEAAAALAALQAANFADPAGFLRRVGISLPAASVPVDKNAKEGKDRAKALQRLAEVQKQLTRQRADAVRWQEVITEAQEELASAQKAAAILQQEYHQLLVDAGDQEDMDLSPPGPSDMEKDISPVLGSIRHLAQALGNTDHLDTEYAKYAAGQEQPVSPAAWIAQAMRQHLGSITNFCAAIDEGAGEYQLVKRRRAECP
jgi:hypothetical protein